MRWRASDPRPEWLDPGRRALHALRLAQHGQALPHRVVGRVSRGARQRFGPIAQLIAAHRRLKLRVMTWGRP